jgi:hypothetical protein
VLDASFLQNSPSPARDAALALSVFLLLETMGKEGSASDFLLIFTGSNPPVTGALDKVRGSRVAWGLIILH